MTRVKTWCAVICGLLFSSEQLVWAEAPTLEFPSPDQRTVIMCNDVTWLHVEGWILAEQPVVKEFDKVISICRDNRVCWSALTASEGKSARTEVVWTRDLQFAVILDEPKSSPALIGVAIRNDQCQVKPVSLDEVIAIGAKLLPSDVGPITHDTIQRIALDQEGRIRGSYRFNKDRKLIINFLVELRWMNDTFQPSIQITAQSPLLDYAETPKAPYLIPRASDARCALSPFH